MLSYLRAALRGVSPEADAPRTPKQIIAHRAWTERSEPARRRLLDRRAEEIRMTRKWADLSYRAATIDDARVLFDWRNDPLTRAMSRNDAPVEWGEHLAWLERRLALPEPHLYVVEAEQTPVATFRIDSDEISYTVAPGHRGVGIATASLRLARQRFGALRAEIKTDNVASIKAATRAGHIVVPI